jgi:hypothetical protein
MITPEQAFPFIPPVVTRTTESDTGNIKSLHDLKGVIYLDTIKMIKDGYMKHTIPIEDWAKENIPELLKDIEKHLSIYLIDEEEQAELSRLIMISIRQRLNLVEKKCQI